MNPPPGPLSQPSQTQPCSLRQDLRFRVFLQDRGTPFRTQIEQNPRKGTPKKGTPISGTPPPPPISALTNGYHHILDLLSVHRCIEFRVRKLLESQCSLGFRGLQCLHVVSSTFSGGALMAAFRLRCAMTRKTKSEAKSRLTHHVDVGGCSKVGLRLLIQMTARIDRATRSPPLYKLHLH